MSNASGNVRGAPEVEEETESIAKGRCMFGFKECMSDDKSSKDRVNLTAFESVDVCVVGKSVVK